MLRSPGLHLCPWLPSPSLCEWGLHASLHCKDQTRKDHPYTLLLLLLLSCFSHVRLRATPWTAAYQASPSMGFSRQEHWSGLPFPSPIPLHFRAHQMTQTSISDTVYLAPPWPSHGNSSKDHGPSPTPRPLALLLPDQHCLSHFMTSRDLPSMGPVSALHLLFQSFIPVSSYGHVWLYHTKQTFMFLQHWTREKHGITCFFF